MLDADESLLSDNEMSVDTTVQVVMPQMGDSVTEGTVLEWHKAEGDSIEADETLVEISTDKVDAEVPAPTSGTVVRILAAEGDTVTVGTVLAEIAPGDGAAAPSGSNGGAPAADAPPGEAETIEIVMPQMGESVNEGVVLEWHVEAGQAVAADDTVIEISTDKVDAEVPAPAAGTITETLVAAGDTVTVGQVLARMTTSGAERRGADRDRRRADSGRQTFSGRRSRSARRVRQRLPRRPSRGRRARRRARRRQRLRPRRPHRQGRRPRRGRQRWREQERQGLR